jgi:hypothetical protein
MTAEAGRLAFSEFDATGAPASLEQHKIDRLRELRAVIDSLRGTQDELMEDLRSSLDRPHL